MTVHLYSAEDYPTVLSWWDAHGVTPTPEACLPRLGVIVRDVTDTPVLAAWASMDNSCGIAFLLFPVANPHTSHTATDIALTHAIGYLTQVLRELDYHTILSATHRASLARALNRRGFTLAEPVHFQTLSLNPPCLS